MRYKVIAECAIIHTDCILGEFGHIDDAIWKAQESYDDYKEMRKAGLVDKIISFRVIDSAGKLVHSCGVI